jgi:hypothetical protein
MQAGIEGRTCRVDPLHAGILQLLPKLSIHGTEAFPDRRQRRGGITSHKSVHVVQYIEQLGYEAGLSPVTQLRPFSVDSLPIIIELGGQTKVTVLQLGYLALELAFLVAPKLGLGFFSPGGRLRAHIGGGNVGSIRASAVGRVLGVEFASKIGFFSHL